MSKTKFSFRRKRLFTLIGIENYNHAAGYITAALRLESRMAERRGRRMAIMGIASVDQHILVTYENMHTIIDEQKIEIAKLRDEATQYKASMERLAECVDRVASERDVLLSEREVVIKSPEFVSVPRDWACDELHTGDNCGNGRTCPRNCDYRKAWEAAGSPR